MKNTLSPEILEVLFTMITKILNLMQFWLPTLGTTVQATLLSFENKRVSKHLRFLGSDILGLVDTNNAF